MSSPVLATKTIEYPESDGLPMAENTIQFEWILKLFYGIEGWFRNDENVFVAGDLLWYPVEGQPFRTAPNIMVAFGRPKGPRSSYLQWEEGGIAPQVAMEIRSPSNTDAHMNLLLDFYQTHGVEEYYLYDPSRNLLEGWRRSRGRLVRIRQMNGWTSPLLGIRFDTSGSELEIYQADGSRFLSTRELSEERAVNRIQIAQERERADEERRKAKEEKRRADEEKRRAEQERRRAEEQRRRAEEEHRRVEEERRRVEEERKLREQLIAKLLAKGIDPDTL